jgi:cytochrome c oxidase subunit 2
MFSSFKIISLFRGFGCVVLLIQLVDSSFLQANIVYSGAAESWQIGFQSPATPLMEGIINFHNHIMFFMFGVGVFVMWLLGRCLWLYNESSNTAKIDNFTHATLVEIVWTVVPALILVIVAVPSFALLYSMDEMLDPAVTLKVVGHQWYWSYEYSDYAHIFSESSTPSGINFDSYMIDANDLVSDSAQLRLLEVDNRVVLPVETHIRVLVTAADVLHSWAVPSFGVKVDACPGRLNQTTLFIKQSGVFYGQCSELCGTNHGFMPICVEAVSINQYVDWLAAQSIQ